MDIFIYPLSLNVILVRTNHYPPCYRYLLCVRGPLMDVVLVVVVVCFTPFISKSVIGDSRTFLTHVTDMRECWVVGVHQCVCVWLSLCVDLWSIILPSRPVCVCVCARTRQRQVIITMCRSILRAKSWFGSQLICRPLPNSILYIDWRCNFLPLSIPFFCIVGYQSTLDDDDDDDRGINVFLSHQPPSTHWLLLCSRGGVWYGSLQQQ